MRGLRAHHRLLAAGAVFLREVRTAPIFRLWSIDDRYPGMVRAASGGTNIVAELYAIPRPGFAQVVESEAEGLCVGRVPLDDGPAPLGVLIEPRMVDGAEEISAFGGWRAYVEAKAISQDW
jgi:hypothetical protein